MIDQNLMIRAWNFDSTFRVVRGKAISHVINPGTYVSFGIVECYFADSTYQGVSDILPNFMARIFCEMLISLNTVGGGVPNQSVCGAKGKF
jgi:hypothetical protein